MTSTKNISWRGLVLIALIINSIEAQADIKDKFALTIGTDISTQIAFTNQGGDLKYLDPTNPSAETKLRSQGILANDTIFIIRGDGSYDKTKYGIEIKMHADASKSKSGNGNNAKNTSVYFMNNIGRFEIGSRSLASDKLKRSAATIAKATGGIDGDLFSFLNPKTIDGQDVGDKFITGPNMPVGCDCTSRANKFTFYPKIGIKELEIGLSYVPDSGLVGTVNKVMKGGVFENKGTSYKDLFDGAILYKNDIDQFSIEASLAGQTAKSKTNNKVNPEIERSNLVAYEAGLLLSIDNLSIAGSYGNWGTSGNNKTHTQGAKYSSDFFTVGASYDITDKTGISLTYLDSKRAGGLGGVDDDMEHNRFKALALSLEAKFTDGVLFYAEGASVKTHRANQNGYNKSLVMLTGIKISI